MVNKMDFQLLSFGMRRIGWIRFWLQSILSVVVAAVLLFSNFVSNDSEGQLSLAPGLSLTSISLILLVNSQLRVGLFRLGDLQKKLQESLTRFFVRPCSDLFFGRFHIFCNKFF